MKATCFIYHQKCRNTCVWDNHVTPPLCQDFRNNVVAWKAKREGLWWFNEMCNYCNYRIHLAPRSDVSRRWTSQKSRLVPWALRFDGLSDVAFKKKKPSEYCERCLKWTHPKKAAWVFQSAAFQLQQQKQTKQQWKIWNLAELEKLISWPPEANASTADPTEKIG